MRVRSATAFVAMAVALCFCGPARAASALDAYAGAIGGAGNGSIPLGCTTFGAPAQLSNFFTFSGPAVPVGGIGACGYVGSVEHATGTVGPVTNSKSVGPVILGNPGFAGSYTGQANSTASYGSLGASAHGTFTGGLPGSPVALFEAAGAAKFSDTLTATSPLVADASAGFVRYQFEVHGSMSTAGTPAPFFFGQTYMVLDIQQQNGPVFEILNAHTRRGGASTISNGAPPAGWTSGIGSLSGTSTFFSLDLPMNWGKPWDVKVGLLAWADGEADSDFLSTATLTGIKLFDAQHVQVTQFSLAAASGTNYLNPVPEPTTLMVMLSGVALLGYGRHRRHGSRSEA